MDNTLKFEQIAGRLINAAGIRTIRWTDKEAGHVVTIDFTGAIEAQKRAIQAEARAIAEAHPTHLLSITMAGE